MAKSEIPTTKIRITAANDIRNFFIAFTILGVGSIVFVKFINFGSLIFQMTIPALVVVLYWIVIFTKGKNVVNLDQLGDSVYYLGFGQGLFSEGSFLKMILARGFFSIIGAFFWGALFLKSCSWGLFFSP